MAARYCWRAMARSPRSSGVRSFWRAGELASGDCAAVGRAAKIAPQKVNTEARYKCLAIERCIGASPGSVSNLLGGKQGCFALPAVGTGQPWRLERHKSCTRGRTCCKGKCGFSGGRETRRYRMFAAGRDENTPGRAERRCRAQEGWRAVTISIMKRA